MVRHGALKSIQGRFRHRESGEPASCGAAFFIRIFCITIFFLRGASQEAFRKGGAAPDELS
jgi:hypothetical protein